MAEDVVDTAKRGYEAFRRAGVEGILEFLDPEIEWRAWDRFSREPNVVHGHDGVRHLFSVYEENFSNLRAEPLEFIPAGDDVVVVPFRLTGKERSTGEPIRLDLVHVWSGGDGIAKRVEVYESKREAFKAAGLNDTD
jgi:ketosteroid isomerase-like protein